MALDGTIYQDFWQWHIVDIETQPKIVTKDLTQLYRSCGGDLNRLCRFGACLTSSSFGLLVIGGIAAKFLLPEEADIVCLNECFDVDHQKLSNHQLGAAVYPPDGCRPLLVGHIAYSSQGRTIIAAGGAVCFSFGTYWNSECWTLTSANDIKGNAWIPAEKLSLPLSTGTYTQTHQEMVPSNTDPAPENRAVSGVPSIEVKSRRDFERILNNRKPVIIKDLDLGNCTKTWSVASLRSKIGADRPVRSRTSAP